MANREKNEYVLETRNIVKKFPGVTALEGIDLRIGKGEIRAIVGENGAGKSTFCNILTGILEATEGEIYFEGNKVHFTHPEQALAAGIRMVYQERNLIPYLTGAQSICLGLEETKMKVFLDEDKIWEIANTIKEKVNAEIPLDIPVEELSPAQQQMIEILRAVVHSPRLLILDEPTASLGREEIAKLFQVVRNLKKDGVSIIFISHKLDEVFSIADTISVFRNGKNVFTGECNELDQKSCVKYMVGRDLESQYPYFETETGDDLLVVNNVSDSTGKLKDINLQVKQGEVVGLFGLVGSGRTELAEIIYGIDREYEGNILFNGERLTDITPGNMIEKGCFLIPEDRISSGLFLDFFDLKNNLTIGNIDRFTKKLGFLNLKKEKEIARDIATIDELSLNYAAMDQDVDALSGGNQQKVVIGRWISRKDIKMLIMDEPTKGIDVGVKHDIYYLMRQYAKKGVGTLCISSDLPELTGICDRIYIIKEGEIVNTLNRGEFDNHKIMEMVL